MPHVILMMGPTASGKTTVGAALARAIGTPFFDADDYCPPSARARMIAGVPLTDDDRWPWLWDLNRRVHACGAGRVVLACSAHKASYRGVLLHGLPDHLIVHLRGDAALLRERMTARTGHFMPVSLLPSQLALMEPPIDGLACDIAEPIESIVATILRHLAPALLP